MLYPFNSKTKVFTAVCSVAVNVPPAAVTRLKKACASASNAAYFFVVLSIPIPSFSIFILNRYLIYKRYNGCNC